MDFKISEEQRSFQELARKFANERFAPHAAQWDRDSIFPIEILKEAATLGFASLYVSEASGGMQLTRLDAALIFEELSKACVSTAAYLSIHNMVAWIIDTYGNTEQKRQWLPKLITMETMASYCLTEPNSGSDAASLQTTALEKDGYYLINGSKAFISGGSSSDIYVCMVRTGESGPKGITAVVIEKGTPGFSFGKNEEKLGWHSQPTTQLFFNDCKVPVTNRLGQVGEGFKIALRALNGGRINIGACSLGGAAACFNQSREYLNSRQQFQKPLSQFQALQFKMADMLTQLEASRLMVYRAAYALDTNHPDAPMFCAMAKRFASDMCFDICNQALQLHGGYGYLQDYPVERYFRDCRVHQILEGTNEIMRLIIARRIFDETFRYD